MGTKFYTYGLQIVYQFILLKVLGAIKTHVLHKMGQPELIIVFLDGSGIQREPQFDLVLGHRIFHNVVDQSIVQLAKFDIRIEWYLLIILIGFAAFRIM